MSNHTSKPKRPRDVSQRAKLVVDIATGTVEDENPDEGKNPAAVALGRLGGKKGDFCVNSQVFSKSVGHE